MNDQDGHQVTIEVAIGGTTASGIVNGNPSESHLGARMHHQSRYSKHRVRRGVIAPFLVLSLTVFFAIFALAVNKSWLWSVREDLKSTADAAALAAAQSLLDDDFLRGDYNLYPDILTRAAQTATMYAAGNLVRGQPLPVLDNPLNDVRGDIVFGLLSTPRAGDFSVVPGRTTADPAQAATNTVLMQARLTRKRGNAPGMIFGPLAGQSYADVQAVTAVTLDRGIRGFRALYGPIPLAPLALLADDAGTNPLSWQVQVEQQQGADTFRFDRTANSFLSNPDQIHEFAANYATNVVQLMDANVVVLQIGQTDLNQIAWQLEFGITGDHLANLGGLIVLPVGGGIDLPAQQLGPNGDQPEIQEFARVLGVLQQQAAVRIWPLFTTFANNQAHVTGFVAARVVNVTPPQADQPLTFTLQATMTNRPDAITDTDLRGRNATMNGNRYITKIRRVE